MIINILINFNLKCDPNIKSRFPEKENLLINNQRLLERSK